MRYRYTAEDEAFREEVRRFIQENLDPELKRKVELGLRLDRADYVKWYNRLYERGWATPNWPKEYGGPGWTHLQRHIFDEECQLAGAPRIVGVNMLQYLIAIGHADLFGQRRKAETGEEEGTKIGGTMHIADNFLGNLQGVDLLDQAGNGQRIATGTSPYFQKNSLWM